MNKSVLLGSIFLIILLFISFLVITKKTEAPVVVSETPSTDIMTSASTTENIVENEKEADDEQETSKVVAVTSSNNALPQSVSGDVQNKAPDIQTAMFANGCFWCVEADMQKVSGVQSVVSGYADGSNENPTYKNYGNFGHREVVQVTYDANVVSYGNLVEHILKHGDPTDPDGSFGDRGKEYAPAIYYENETEREIALNVIAAVNASNVYGEILTIEVIPKTMFWEAEAYHQDYAEKNPLKYFYYRTASGRTSFIKTYWGERASIFEFSG